MSKVLIVGGGAAGMFASIFAAKNGNEVHVFEKNEKLGKKLFITGKGRCNVTNACDVEELFQNMVSNEKFMYSSFYGFTNQDVMDFFENAGLRLKTERGNRVFPQSDHSSDVIRTLELEMKRNGVHIHLYSNVERMEDFPILSWQMEAKKKGMPALSQPVVSAIRQQVPPEMAIALQKRWDTRSPNLHLPWFR